MTSQRMLENTTNTVTREARGMFPSPPYQNPNPIFDEQRWIVHIRRALDDEDDPEQESDTHVSIFNVPKTLLLTSPESYVPQLVALGPYHHHRPELHGMERYKLSAAKSLQKRIPGIKFHNLVDKLSRAEHRFRACYHKFINLNGETLAWMMAVDSCFLLEFLRDFAVSEGPVQKSGLHDAIIRDTLMLENQVPLFSVMKTLELLSGSVGGADDELHAMAIGLCRDVSPFAMIDESGGVDLMNKSAHLLELLYNLTVPGVTDSSEITLDADGQSPNKAVSTETGPLSLMKRLMLSKPVRFILKLPWMIISNLPGMIMLRQVEYFCFSREKDDNDGNSVCRHPLMEEIAIPSVTELSNAGVRFAATSSGIPGIHFDEKTATFHLAAISVDVNTETVIRNLVAYEACGNASRQLICARYTELMNGIIDSEEDARILREEGIIWNHLKSDEDVADMWNGMNKSIRLTKVPFLDRVIEDVNSYYDGRWKVRIGKMLKRHVFGSWQSLTFMAALLLLFFVSLQAFSSIFSCARARLLFRGTKIN